MSIVRGIIVCFFAVASMNTAYSKDISTGTVELSGDSSFSISSSKYTEQGISGSEDTDTVSLSLTALYYVSPNVGVGLFWSKEDQDIDDGFNSETIAINFMGPLAGYNVSVGPASSVMFYGGFVLIGDFESEVNGFTVASGDISGHIIGANFKHFLTDSVSVNVGLSMTHIEVDEDGGNKSESDGRDLSVGLSVYF